MIRVQTFKNVNPAEIVRLDNDTFDMVKYIAKEIAENPYCEILIRVKDGKVRKMNVTKEILLDR